MVSFKNFNWIYALLALIMTIGCSHESYSQANSEKLLLIEMVNSQEYINYQKSVAAHQQVIVDNNSNFNQLQNSLNTLIEGTKLICDLTSSEIPSNIKGLKIYISTLCNMKENTNSFYSRYPEYRTYNLDQISKVTKTAKEQGTYTEVKYY